MFSTCEECAYLNNFINLGSCWCYQMADAFTNYIKSYAVYGTFFHCKNAPSALSFEQLWLSFGPLVYSCFSILVSIQQIEFRCSLCAICSSVTDDALPRWSQGVCSCTQAMLELRTSSPCLGEGAAKVCLSKSQLQ